MLSTEQINSYNEKGYLVVENAIPVDKLKELQQVTDDFVNIAANNVLNPTGDYTVAAWFKQEGNNTADTWQSVMTSRSSSGTNAKGYMMYLNPTVIS